MSKAHSYPYYLRQINDDNTKPRCPGFIMVPLLVILSHTVYKIPQIETLTFMHSAELVLENCELIDVSKLLKHWPQMFFIEMTWDLANEQLDISIPRITGWRRGCHCGRWKLFRIWFLCRGGMTVHSVCGWGRNEHGEDEIWLQY